MLKNKNNMLILVINSGSSSIKYQLLDMASEAFVAGGIIERIGGNSRITRKDADGHQWQKELSLPTHREALRELLSVLAHAGEIRAIGHRVVHGGTRYTSPTLITEDVLAVIEASSEFAPLHNSANILGIRACMEAFGPEIPQVAVFDTAFHMNIPPYAYLYPIPYNYYEKYGIRRFGFHGISHRYASERCAQLMGRQDLKIITCHLGNGCSLAAVKNGVCIDTSMGMTPNEGVMMGTRSGSIDPSIPAYIAKWEGISYEEALDICNRESGLQGVSGISNDYRDLSQSDNEKAALALEMQRYQILKTIGSYLAAMDGADAIVFTGGIGENAPELRQYICDHLHYVGVVLDETENREQTGECCISSKNSKVAVFVIPTNEELVIARETCAFID